MQAHKTADMKYVESSNSRAEQALSVSQGAYYLITGAWPLVSMRTFESVTGRKRDRWLAKTVGMLVGVVGAALILAARDRNLSEEAQLLGTGCAAGLAAIDLIYVANGRIAPIYLLDAAAEIALVNLWTGVRVKRRRCLIDRERLYRIRAE
ncbi:MAG TPA: hypothetical protein VHM64_10025 [Candidatus Binatia bacterium]|nr:hypothetical protein [Candidatus Binatia bacterium]